MESLDNMWPTPTNPAESKLLRTLFEVHANEHDCHKSIENKGILKRNIDLARLWADMTSDIIVSKLGISAFLALTNLTNYFPTLMDGFARVGHICILLIEYHKVIMN